MLPFVKHHVLYFLFEFLFISVVLFPAVVDEDICENDDATLTWQIASALNVESKVLYKGQTLVASWPKGYQLIIYPPYENRLLQIGESAVRIKNATRSDSGTYKLILSLKSMTNTSEALTDLYVIVPPTNDCIAIITHEEDTLRAKVPESGCGIPGLIPYWINHGNISVLKPESRHQPRTYTACPVGKALKCFTGSSDRLCANFTLDELWPKNESKTWSLEAIIIPSSIGLLLIFVIVILVLCLRGKCNPKSATSTKQNLVLHNRTERNPLMQEETSVTASIEQSLVVHNSTEGNTLIHEEASATVAAEASNIPHKHSNENLLILKETSATALSSTMAIGRDRMMTSENNNLVVGLTLPLGDIARVNEINVKIVFNEMQMEQKQRHDPGLTDTREDSKEGNQAFQSSEDPTHEEQCITTKKDDIIPEERQNLCGTCHREDACMILIPCGHMDACYSCAKRLDKCTKCKIKVQHTIKPFCQRV